MEWIHVVEYVEKNIINDDTMVNMESWLITFQISFFCILIVSVLEGY